MGEGPIINSASYRLDSELIQSAKENVEDMIQPGKALMQCLTGS